MDNVVTIPENLLHCPICLSIFIEPVTCSKGHTFCMECILEHLKTSIMCPIGREQLDKSFIVNYTIKGILEHTVIKCKNNRCLWLGTGLKYNVHVKKCAFELLPCTWCKTHHVERMYMDIHKKVCKYKPYKCTYCDIDINSVIHKDHLTYDCVGYEVCCTHCSKLLPMYEFIVHVCMEEEILCPFSLSCGRFKRKDAGKHYSEPGRHYNILYNLYNNADLVVTYDIDENKEFTIFKYGLEWSVICRQEFINITYTINTPFTIFNCGNVAFTYFIEDCPHHEVVTFIPMSRTLISNHQIDRKFMIGNFSRIKLILELNVNEQAQNYILDHS